MVDTLPQLSPSYRWTVKRRLRVLAYVQTHSLMAASQHFGLDRRTIRQWRDRRREAGMGGLVPRYPAQRPSRLAPETLALIEHARKVLEYGRRGRRSGCGACIRSGCRRPRSPWRFAVSVCPGSPAGASEW